MNPTSPPIALTVAGSDSSAGAGVQADLKAFAAHGVYGLNAVTAVVAETPGHVALASPVKPTLLEFQLKGLVSSFPISCVKTGMLATAAHVLALDAFLEQAEGVPLVVDPVFFASAGTELLDPAGIAELRERILPRATLITPNIPEAEHLLGKELASEKERSSAVRVLHEEFGCDVLLKGGHAAGPDEITDYAWIDGERLAISHRRLDVPDLHGTGCTLSAAIAARIARGEPLLSAVEGGIGYLQLCLEHHFHWPDPAATGALNHVPDGVDS